MPPPPPPPPPGPSPPPSPPPGPIPIRIVTDPKPPLLAPITGPPPPPPGSKNRKHDEFYPYWDRLTKKTIPKKSDPPSLDVDQEGRPTHHPEQNEEGIITSQNAGTSFKEAADSCRAKVKAIAAECRRLNQKYTDRTFPLPSLDALISLDAMEDPTSVKGLAGVGSARRVEDIFDDPQFFVDGATASDIKQGINGDCWFLAALAALSGKPDLIERLCVERDEEAGVYGFVFFRDGEWISEVVDDKLCLKQADDMRNYHTEWMVKVRGDTNPMESGFGTMAYGNEYTISKLPQEFRENLRKGSESLFFGKCQTKNETWLPLIEKAYAKAHGDYQAIEGGVTGEGIEDLTGGIATYITSEDILSKKKLWEEMMKVNDEFLFGCASRAGRDNDDQDEVGLVRGHAYTVLKAVEMKQGDSTLKLLKLRNPWGSHEWNGAWSDGSKEWTPEMMKELDHTFGDDGIFWIKFEDFLKHYPEIDRIRLFNDDWTITQQWTTLTVPWAADYLDTKFKVTLSQATPVVLVLMQPDERYFHGFLGRYRFDLHFRLYKDGVDTYLLRSMTESGSSRSVSAELDLEPGTYTIWIKVTTRRIPKHHTAEEVMRKYREIRRNKLLGVGKQFDLSHAKGRLREAEKANLKRMRQSDREKDKEGWLKERKHENAIRKQRHQRRKRIKEEIKRKIEAKRAVKREEMKKKRKEREEKRKEWEEKARKEEKKRKEELEKCKKEKAAAEKGKKGKKKAKGEDEAKETPATSTISADQPTPEATSTTDSVPTLSPQTQTAPEGDVEIVPETKQAGDIEPTQDPKGKADSKAQLDTLATTDAKAQPDTQVETGAKAQSETESQSKPKVDSTTEETDKSKATDKPREVEKPEPKVETNLEASLPSKPKTKAEPPTRDGTIFPVDDEAQEASETESEPALPKEDEVDFPTEAVPAGHDDSQSEVTPPGSRSPSPPPRRRGHPHYGPNHPKYPHPMPPPLPGPFPPPPPPGRHGMPPPFRGPGRHPADDSDISDVPISPISSVNSDDFDWDSALDDQIPSDDDSEFSLDEKDEIYHDDKWNALCVVGLRVCSMDKEVKIEVIHEKK